MAEAIAPVLEVQGLTKRFGALLASDAVTLDLRPGEIHALIGPNGAGKSTLIKQVAGELKPDEGAVRFDGRDVGGLNAVARARAGLARSFQVSALAMELSALENVMLALIGRSQTAFRFFRVARRDRDLVAEAMGFLERLGLADLALRPTTSLSHGHRRRLELAIALAMKPKAFLLDEPMAGLGADGSKEMVALLKGLKREAPILLVEHDMDAIFALADRVSVMVYGKLIVTGSVEEIRANQEVRDAYLGASEVGGVEAGA